MTDCQKQAQDFCDKYGVTIMINKSQCQTPPPFNEKENDLHGYKYDVTIKRNGKAWTFPFWDSIMHKELTEYIQTAKANALKYGMQGMYLTDPQNYLHKSTWHTKQDLIKVAKKVIPTLDIYDILACITKENPMTFQDFCDNYGYETDSRRAERIYHAVCEEWNQVYNMFSDCLEDLRAIQ